ncbi:MAG: CAP domain-containing protein [Campylobacterales bacterium]
MKTKLILALLTTTLYSDSISYLNEIRDSVGLNRLTQEKHLSKASLAHARYLLNHGINSHYEKDGKYFFAKTPSLRAVKSGYSTKDVKENIATNANSEEKSISVLFSAIYHRFVFLDFAIDQIGKGIAKDDKKPNIKSVYVYDMGLSSIAKLCQEDFLTLEGVYYMQNLCKDSMHYIPKDAYQKAKEQLMAKNPKMIIFPNINQSNVPTAFFQEFPNPMPGYKVSGYPISVQLNPYYFKDIKLKKFRLYNQKGRMVRVKLLKSSNDPNKKLKPYQFAIIPKQRLDYNSTYTAYVEVYTNKGKIKQKWSFKTQSFNIPLYTIKHNHQVLHIGDKKNIILYFKPKNRKDILQQVNSNTKIRYIDPNTIKVHINKLPIVVKTRDRQVTIKQ